MPAHAVMKSLLGSRWFRSLVPFSGSVCRAAEEASGSEVHSPFARLGLRGVM